ncbi:MAG: MBL fold metallo-hydrolase [Candidatus Protochlamydia sp.]|nr:MBL fold metallo-hydrolase [Candidatus Protochlamydia sp.]
MNSTISHLFGTKNRPAAILLTHGHFDHVGSLKQLIEQWEIPVYAHPLEFPYLTGRFDYPPPDPSVKNGLVAELSWIYPKKPIDITSHLKQLSTDYSVPFLPEWKYIHTPGHSPEHVSFFRDSDKLLIAGDAIVTTKQESAFFVLLQKKELSGPPKYFTYDWEAAGSSVRELAKLNPKIIATGHGQPLYEEQAAKDLRNLAENFHSLAVPKQGRYVTEPAVVNESGIEYVPPKKWAFPFLLALLFIIISFLIFLLIYTLNAA